MIKFSESQIEYIVAQYRKGYTLKEIGADLGISRTPIKHVLVEHCPEYEGKKRISTAFIPADTTKECPRCHQIKLLSEYNKGNGMYGRRSICRECEKIIQNTPERRRRRRELELKRRISPEYIKHRNEMDKKRRLQNPKHWIWASAKFRAKRKGIEFTITENDFELPTTCPLLEIPMWKNPEEACANSYSLDRIDSTKGYIKGNVWVISKRANSIKSDATLEELELLVKNLRNKIRNGIY